MRSRCGRWSRRLWRSSCHSGWIAEGRVVVADVADGDANLPDLHFVGGAWAEKIDGQTRRIGGREPSLVVARRQDRRHTVVDGRGEFIRLRRENGVSFQRLAGDLVFPALP